MNRGINKSCSNCGEVFLCSPENISGCHCSVVDLNKDERQFIAGKSGDCFCNTCLLKFKKEYADLPEYYFDNGLMIMTAKYHLQRGNCCGSGCRHCPYKRAL